MEQPKKNKSKAQVVFWLAAISSWLSLLLPPLIVFGMLFWIIVMVYLFIRKTKLKWYLLLVSAWTLVPLWSFMSGSKDYFQGTAAIETVGMPNDEFFNLDPDLRVWNSTSGCLVMGFEPFTQAPNNWAVKFWTGLLGAQKGIYTGVYPTREQAEEIISIGERVSFNTSADTVLFNYDNQQLFLQTSNYNDLAILRGRTTGKVSILNNECLLVEPLGDTTKRVILLADKRNGKVFARYYDFQAP